MTPRRKVRISNGRRCALSNRCFSSSLDEITRSDLHEVNAMERGVLWTELGHVLLLRIGRFGRLWVLLHLDEQSPTKVEGMHKSTDVSAGEREIRATERDGQKKPEKKKKDPEKRPNRLRTSLNRELIPNPMRYLCRRATWEGGPVERTHLREVTQRPPARRATHASLGEFFPRMGGRTLSYLNVHIT